jgi:hypothetical protein
VKPFTGQALLRHWGDVQTGFLFQPGVFLLFST